MSKLIRPLLLPVVLVALAACTGVGASGSSGPTSAPSSSAPPASPSASPASVGAIDHATGATDVLLRYEQGGGFVAPSFLATQAPIFTLYGDGTIVFRNPLAETPPPIGSVFRQNPLRTAKLSEDQIQEVLAYALGDGGLGTARANYENNMVADASTAIFTIDAGGLKKAVSVYALGMDGEGVPDLLARAAFQRLADRLSDFDKGGTIATDVYAPKGYRGIVEDGQAAPDQRAWPWADLKPTDFAFPADPNAYQMATHVLTPEQVGHLALEDIEGGFQGLVIQSPDQSKVYSLSLRPLLPDETQ